MLLVVNEGSGDLRRNPHADRLAAHMIPVGFHPQRLAVNFSEACGNGIEAGMRRAPYYGGQAFELKLNRRRQQKQNPKSTSGVTVPLAALTRD